MVRDKDSWVNSYNCDNTIYPDTTHGVERGFISRHWICIKTTPCTRLSLVWSGSHRDRFDNKRGNDNIRPDKKEET